MAITSPHLLPSGTWVPDRDRSEIAFSAGSHRGRFDDHDLTLVVASDGEAGLAGIVAGATFATTALRRDGDLIEVDGEVTINGRTLAVTACGTVTEPAGALVVEMRSVVDRRQFAVESEIGPEVTIDVRLTLVRGSA